MTHSKRTTATALAVALAVAVSASPAAAQDASGDPIPPQLPPLAEITNAVDPARVCELAGGKLQPTDPTRCALASELEADPWFVGSFGPELEVASIAAAGGPVALGEALPDKGVAIERVSFVPSVDLSGKATKRLKRRQKVKDASVVQGRSTDWGEADTVGLVSLHLDGSVDARKLSRDGAFLVRVQSGAETIDAGYVDRKPILKRRDGRNARGMAFFGEDRVDILFPGGIPGDFTTSLFQIDGDGNASAQQVGGPGAADALTPQEPFAPVLGCGLVGALVDQESTVDGISYDLEGMQFVLSSSRIPEGMAEAQPTFSLTLSPSGSREGQDLDDITVDVLPSESPVRNAIALEVDLSALGLSGPTGFQFGEVPYTLTGMTATLPSDHGYAPYDTEAGVALLEEAGWLDTDGDGVREAQLDDVATELSRVTGGAFTESPAIFGWGGCGRDAHWRSIQDPCQLPVDPATIDTFADLLGEDAGALKFLPGSFVDGYTGCTVFGEEEAFLGTWLLGETYGDAAGYDAAVLDPFTEIGCEIDAARPALSGVARVGQCPDAGVEIFHDGSRGFDTYWAFSGNGIDPESIEALIPTFTEVDLDGDGTFDRFDPDVDGDGVLDGDDHDDDGDGVPDDRDYVPLDPDAYLSPNAFAEFIASLQG